VPRRIQSSETAPDDVLTAKFKELLDEIEHEHTPERLLRLARELQEQLAQRRQRQSPH
jgi:hypothetical protein